MGPELDSETWDRLQHETRMNIPQYVMKRIQYIGTIYSDETESNRIKVHQAGPRAFTEQCLD